MAGYSEIVPPLLISKYEFSLTSLMTSHDLSNLTITNQIAFDQRNFHSTLDFECVMDRLCQALVSKLGTLDTVICYLTDLLAIFGYTRLTVCVPRKYNEYTYLFAYVPSE